LRVTQRREAPLRTFNVVGKMKYIYKPLKIHTESHGRGISWLDESQAGHEPRLGE
jgi:hypothetical protein